jgi:hypothetical protein
MVRASGLLPIFAAMLAVAKSDGYIKPQVTVVARIDALEAEHLSLLSRETGAPHGGQWTPPIFDGNRHLFSWRVQAIMITTSGTGVPARNVTQASAVLTLTTDGMQVLILCDFSNAHC